MIVTNVGRDAVDAAASGAQVIAGRDEPRERFTARQTNDVASYGKTVWSWHPLLMLNRRRSLQAQPGARNRQSADDGDKKELVAEEITA